MEDYYQVLQYLRETKVDREYIFEFRDANLLKYSGSTGVELDDNHISTHFYGIYLQNIEADDTLVIKLDKPRSFQDVNILDFILESPSINIDEDTLSVSLSNSPSGLPHKYELTPLSGQCDVDAGTQNSVKYIAFDETNTSPYKKNRVLSDIQSVIITFNKPIPELYITDAVFRRKNFHITLEELDYNIKSGKDYIAMQLYVANPDSIPPVLDYLCYKAAAAYAWLTWWEDEGKSMNDGTVNGENYAARLFEQIDGSIEKYIEANPITLADDINTNLIGYSWMQDVVRRPYYSRRRHSKGCGRRVW